MFYLRVNASLFSQAAWQPYCNTTKLHDNPDIMLIPKNPNSNPEYQQSNLSTASYSVEDIPESAYVIGNLKPCSCFCGEGILDNTAQYKTSGDGLKRLIALIWQYNSVISRGSIDLLYLFYRMRSRRWSVVLTA